MINKIKNAFGLKAIPFSKEILTKELFQTTSLKECSAMLEMAVENEDCALITGNAGSGKSCILRHYCNALDENRYRVVYLSSENTKIGDIAKQILSALNATVPFHSSKAIRELKKTIQIYNSEKGIKPVVLLDEAQHLPIHTLCSLKSLLNYNMDSKNMMFLLFSGQCELESTLGIDKLESLNRRIRIRYRTKPLAIEEAALYIKHQMNIAGMQRQFFSDEAVSRIYDYSKGLISKINLLCFNAIICAVSEAKEIIDPGVIENVNTQIN